MKSFFCFVALLLSCNLYGIDWLKELKENFILDSSCIMGEMEYGNRFRRDGEEIFVEYGIYNKNPINQDGVIVPATDKFPLNVMRLNEETGFTEIEIQDSESPFQMMIVGDFHLLGIPKEKFFWKDKKAEDFFEGVWGMSSIGLPSVLRKHDLAFVPKDSFPLCDVIEDVKSSSYLVEYSGVHKIEYSGEHLDKYIVASNQVYSNGHSVNQYCFPWVENKEGTGEGEWIEFFLNSP